MTMALPRPSAVGIRPAYLDNIYRDSPLTPTLHTPSLHSSKSSLSGSSSNFDLRTAYHASRPLSPFVEECSDQISIQSKRSFLGVRRFKLGRMFNRRTYPPMEVKEMAPPPSSPPASAAAHARLPSNGRRPSLPKLQTGISLPRGVSTYAKKPLLAVPQAQAQELSCKRCYYYAARHCSGWVMGGSNGDACETCLAAGFFGEK